MHSRILLKSRREAFQVWQATRQDRLDPGLQRAGRPLAHHLGKCFGERSDLGNRGIMLPYLPHLFLGIWGALLGTTHQEIRELPSRQTRWAWCLDDAAGVQASEGRTGCPRRKAVTYRYTTA